MNQHNKIDVLDEDLFRADPFTYLLSLFATEEGEDYFVQVISELSDDSPVWHFDLVDTWIVFVKKVLEDKSCLEQQLAATSFVRLLVSLSEQGVLVSRADNFTPSSRTPWGGREIRSLMQATGISHEGAEIGEYWACSFQKNFPSKVSVLFREKLVGVPVWLIGELNPDGFYGLSHVKQKGTQPPFLTKLLNTGSWLDFRVELCGLFEELLNHKEELYFQLSKSCCVGSLTEILEKNYHEWHKALCVIEKNLKKTDPFFCSCFQNIHRNMLAKNISVQIHPDKDYCQNQMQKKCYPKAEAWVVIKAETGAGVYLGLKELVTETQMRQTLEAGEDVSDLLNFIPVKAGDAFFVPAGTIHAIGAGILLAEPQETSETTFRYYDWGRKDALGQTRELHIEEALAVTNWNAARGAKFVEKDLKRIPKIISGGTEGQALHENIVNEKEFSFDRLSFQAGDIFFGDVINGLHGLIVTQGVLVVIDDKGAMHGEFFSGQNLLIPSVLENYVLRASQPACVFLTRTTSAHFSI